MEMLCPSGRKQKIKTDQLHEKALPQIFFSKTVDNIIVIYYFLLLLLFTANGFSPGGRGTTIRQQTNNTHDNRQ
jgi:hypothetical protein